jgi:hypothetical protein
MAQMPIQSMPGRAAPFAALLPAASSQPRLAIPRAAYLHDNGGIPGGMLRPGAIDQEAFKAHLMAARKSTVTEPPASAAAPAFAGIPTLTPAQLAALGAVEVPPAGELVIDIPAPNPADPGQGTGQRHAPPGQPGGVPGGAGTQAAPLFQGVPSAPPTGDAAPTEAAPDRADAMAPSPAASSPEPQSAPPPAAPASLERGPIPGSLRGADGAWELTRLPDKDERDLLRGQKWRVVESEESRRLFLGPDGEFGWDDFVDLINPLQHIPFVNIAYRAITGDEIHGAARMVDFALGPLAGVSTAVDLAFRDVTGDSMAHNAVAAVFGTGEPASGEEPAGDVSVNTASATQLSETGTIRRGSHW